MQNASLDESQGGIKILGQNINNLRYAHDTTLMTESGEELKSLLMKVKEESEKVPGSSPGWSRVLEGETARRPIQMLIRDTKSNRMRIAQ